ncbi:uncharacterized protein [Arachis hypogaea]|uniref:uncharacterized protein n=1 Tax=Arachis hypogaea TaxID=3818 RepID=UPI0010FC51EE|nr:uncharacterized protein LOC114924144 [Arachis hypogaea]
MLRGHLEKQMLALIEFDLQYVPAKAVKGQVIADFLANNSKDLNDQGANVIDIEVAYWKLYFDGSKHKNGARVGILIISLEGIPSEFLFELKYPCSNNVAEYEALILGLEILISKGALEVQILGDSQLVLKQLSKEFKCNNEKLQNQIASRYRIGPETLKKLASIHQILVPANEREVLCIEEREDTDWRKPITQYLRNLRIPIDKKIKLRAINFVLMADELYKKGIDGSLSRCLGQDDQNIALDKVHNGICGAHQAEKKMKWVLYRNHVYWSSMIKDYIDYAKHKFILVAIDYFTKWVEAIPLIEVGQNEILDFIEEHIIHRFGIPQTLSTDQGAMFTGQRIKNFVTSRNINMVTSTPYYAQANGRSVEQNDLPVDDYWNAMFDELNELDSEQILALESMI